MIGKGWGEHRAADGELLGWVRPVAGPRASVVRDAAGELAHGEARLDAWEAVDLLGRVVETAPDRATAREALERRGTAWVRLPWWLAETPVRLAAVVPGERVVVRTDVSATGAAKEFTLPWPAPRALSLAPVPRPRGVERYLREGRIASYPSSAAERVELLALVASWAFEAGRRYTEAEVNERLAAFADDVAHLRRYLVDFGLLERTPSGSAYQLPAPRDPR